MMRFVRTASSVAASVAMLVVLAGCAGSATDTVAPPTAPPAQEDTAADPARALVDRKCSMCHSTQRVYDADYDEQGWAEVVDRMVKNGLVISSDERAAVIAFLANR